MRIHQGDTGIMQFVISIALKSWTGKKIYNDEGDEDIGSHLKGTAVDQFRPGSARRQGHYDPQQRSLMFPTVRALAREDEEASGNTKNISLKTIPYKDAGVLVWRNMRAEKWESMRHHESELQCYASRYRFSVQSTVGRIHKSRGRCELALLP